MGWQINSLQYHVVHRCTDMVDDDWLTLHSDVLQYHSEGILYHVIHADAPKLQYIIFGYLNNVVLYVATTLWHQYCIISVAVFGSVQDSDALAHLSLFQHCTTKSPHHVKSCDRAIINDATPSVSLSDSNSAFNSIYLLCPTSRSTTWLWPKSKRPFTGMQRAFHRW